jgi:glycosyltransferase involved in cell wall biosynthesis
MIGKYENRDRRIEEPNLEPVDILLLTLDAEIYLEKCLDTVYREIPVSKILVVDGGSKDKTLEILRKYPRVEIHERPDIRTTGKGYEFLLARATTPWIVFMDADIELPQGWYDEMLKYRDRYDFFGCKRILHYEFYRVDPTSLDLNQRPMGAPWLARLDCLKNYHVDDDYMWRATDILLRQVVEKDGYKFGKISTTYHYHHTTDSQMYESDKEKRGSLLVFEEPKMEILNKANWEKRQDDFRKAVIKYLDPEFVYPRGDEETLRTLTKLDTEWVKKTSIKWYKVLEEYKTKERKERRSIRRRLINLAVYTAAFLAAIARAVRDYVGHVTESLIRGG